MKLAYFSPLPPARSGIADHSAELLPPLASQADITLFVTDPAVVAAGLQAQFAIRPLTAYPHEQWQYDLPLYHMGNSAHHTTIYQMSLRYPGLVVLHDVGLHHLIAHHTSGQGNLPGYTRERGYAQGLAGINHTWQVRTGQRPNDPFDLPLHNRLADVSLGLIVHSQYARDLVHEVRPSLPLQVIPELMTLQTGQPQPRDFAAAQDIVFASLGQVTPHKHITLVLDVLARLLPTHPHLFYLIIGEVLSDSNLEEAITARGLHGRVHVTGHVEGLPNFVNWLLAADVVINLRHPTVGETSAAALRAMAAGKPLIVFDHGWYSEIPSSAALKIPPMDAAALLAAMRRLAESPMQRQHMGQAGQAYVRDQCAPEKVAMAYATFIHQLLNQYEVRHA